MTKTASIVGMKCIELAELFETITVVGMIICYDIGKVVRVVRAVFDFMERRTIVTFSSRCDVLIDVMVARIYFTATASLHLIKY